MCSLCTNAIDTMKDTNSLTRDQQRFMKMVTASIHHREDKHYDIALPLRSADLNLPASLALAEQRACYLKSKFLKKPTFYKEYKQFVENMIRRAMRRKLNANKAKMDSCGTFFTTVSIIGINQAR